MPLPWPPGETRPPVEARVSASAACKKPPTELLPVAMRTGIQTAKYSGWLQSCLRRLPSEENLSARIFDRSTATQSRPQKPEEFAPAPEPPALARLRARTIRPALRTALAASHKPSKTGNYRLRCFHSGCRRARLLLLSHCGNQAIVAGNHDTARSCLPCPSHAHKPK